jgi:hypothetical protein
LEVDGGFCILTVLSVEDDGARWQQLPKHGAVDGNNFHVLMFRENMVYGFGERTLNPRFFIQVELS